MRPRLLVLVSVLGWAFAAAAGPFHDLDREYRAGRLSLDDYLVARTFLALSPERLAGTRFERLREGAKPVRCGSVFIRDVAREYPRLAPETQRQLAFAVQRPTDAAGGIDNKRHLLPQLYGTARFVIHWTTGSDGGAAADAPPLADGADADTVPDYINNLGVYFEESWDFVVTARGFLPPPSDAGVANDSRNRNPDGRYDVFVYNMAAYGYTEPDNATAVTSSIIAVDNDYAGFPSPQAVAMQVTAAHEFCHASQFAYDLFEDSWWMEVTSTWMESEVYPGANDNLQYLPYWFANSDILGLTVFDGVHEYGSFIWGSRLSEDFGDDIIRQIWEACATASAVPATNTVLAGRGSTMVDEFMRFVTGNYFLEHYYADGAAYRAYLQAHLSNPGVYVEYRYAASDGVPKLISNSNVNDTAWMDAWAADYVEVETAPALAGYEVLFNGLRTGTAYGVLAVLRDGASFESVVCPLDANKDGLMTFVSAGFDGAVVIMANASGTDTVNPTWTLTVGSLPAAPVNVQPSDGATASVAPLLAASAFSDADGGAHAGSRWQGATPADVVLWDSTTAAATSIQVPPGLLTLGQDYRWRVAYRDDAGGWSAFSAATSFTAGVVEGDVDGDGAVTITDVILALRMAIGLDPEDLAADLDGDESVTISDVILILRKSLGL